MGVCTFTPEGPIAKRGVDVRPLQGHVGRVQNRLGESPSVTPQASASAPHCALFLCSAISLEGPPYPEPRPRGWEYSGEQNGQALAKRFSAGPTDVRSPRLLVLCKFHDN